MKRYLYVVLWAAVLLCAGCALLILESDLLWKTDEMNLFLHTPLFFKQQMVVPGGLLTYVGTFFTQFFYHPWQGVLLLCCWWLLLMWLTKNAFGIPAKWASLMLIPVALVLVTIVDTGYWVYMLKLRGHFFVTTIGTTVVAALLWGFRALPPRYFLRALYLCLVCLVGYPLVGIYGLAATLLMGIFSWRLEPRRNAIIYSLLAIIATVAVPLLCYRYIFCEINQANIYWAELPLYNITVEHHAYYIPFYLLALFFAVMAATYRPNRSEEIRKKTWWCLAQVALIALIVFGVSRFWYRDENFQRELSMQHLIEQLDWEGVVREGAAQQDEPTRAIVMMRNLALARLGRQGDEMFRYKNGSKKSNAPFDVRMMQVIGPLIYYHYGMLNYCIRYSSEMGVEYDWRVLYYKLLIRCALLNGEKPVARKYINILKRTTFHDEWARKAEQLLIHPEKIAQDPEMAPITHMNHYPSYLGGDQGFVESFLMKQLTYSQASTDPIYQEQCLLATLFTRDIKCFWYHFAYYLALHKNQPIPIHIQEAAYLFSQMDDRDTSNAPFLEGVKGEFSSFMNASQKYEGMDVDVVRPLLEPIYGHTYYFYYYMMSNLIEY